MATKKEANNEISALELVKGEMTLAIVGTSPLLCNSMPAKAWRDLLLPPVRRRKSQADLIQSQKHDPIAEFNSSMYKAEPHNSATAISLPAPALKGAMMTAALDLPGTSKAEIGRLLWVDGYRLPLWGVPMLFMSIVRMADIKKTPDVRTRALLRKWATIAKVQFVRPNLNEQSIVNLGAAGGITAGLGDGRQEKGKLNFGQYRIANLNDPEFLEICANGGRAAQLDAISDPQCHDEESEELLSWFEAELTKRQGKKAA